MMLTASRPAAEPVSRLSHRHQGHAPPLESFEQFGQVLDNSREPVQLRDDFEDAGGPRDDRAILRNIIRPTAKGLGFYFEGFGWHSFRRQNITVLQEEGATTFEAMAPGRTFAADDERRVHNRRLRKSRAGSPMIAAEAASRAASTGVK